MIKYVHAASGSSSRKYVLKRVPLRNVGYSERQV